MTTTDIKWTPVTITLRQETWLMPRDITLRTAKTGRGKNATILWQQRVTNDLYIDGDTPAEAIEHITAASAGMLDARIDVETSDDYAAMSITGYTEDVPAEYIERAEAKLQADAAARRAQTEAKAAADRARLLELAKQYPDVLQGLK